MTEYDKYRKFRKVVMEVKLFRSPKNGQLLHHTDPDAGTPGSTSWRYEDDHDMDEEFYSTVESKNHGDSQLGQQQSAATKNSSGHTTTIARETVHSSYSKSECNPNSQTPRNQHRDSFTQPQMQMLNMILFCKSRSCVITQIHMPFSLHTG